MAPWCLFDSITREVSSTNIALRHLLLEVIGKEFGNKKVHFSCFNGSYIWDFGNTWHQGYNKIEWCDPLNEA